MTRSRVRTWDTQGLLTGGETVLLNNILQDCLDVIRENDGSRNAVHMTYTAEIDVPLSEAQGQEGQGRQSQWTIIDD